MRQVTVTDINEPATLYRVGHLLDSAGLWYDIDGRETRVIDALNGAASAALPMEPHPIFRDGGFEWFSVADSLESLKLWFPEKDMQQLFSMGYTIEAIRVRAYRRLEFKEYTHEVFHLDQVIPNPELIRSLAA